MYFHYNQRINNYIIKLLPLINKLPVSNLSNKDIADIGLTYLEAFSYMHARVGINYPDNHLASTPFPSQKVLNDFFLLLQRKDDYNFLRIINDGEIKIDAATVTFLLNQNDPTFSSYKDGLSNGEIDQSALVQYSSLLKTGEYFNLSWPIFFFTKDELLTLKHPFWKDSIAKIDSYGSGLAAYDMLLPHGTNLDGKLPIPKNDLGNIKPNGGMLFNDYQHEKKLTELYIGFFGRAAEHNGLEFHKKTLNDLLASGMSEDQAFVEISNDFWEAGKNFSHMTGFTENSSNFEFVAQVYTNVLGRPNAVETDLEGVSFWTEHMNHTGASHGEMVLKLLEGAHHYINTMDDAVSQYVGNLLENRTNISLFFSQKTVSGDLFGDHAIQTGWDVIQRIDQNISSVANVKSAIINNTLLQLPEIELVGVGMWIGDSSLIA